jgi:hypothetical protein
MTVEPGAEAGPPLPRRVARLALAGAGILLLAALFVLGSWWYTTAQLSRAAQEGVYAAPEAGMRALINQNWQGIQKVEIVYVGPNQKDGSDPHIGFVMVKVWAASRTGGGKVGNSEGDFDYAGTFFLHTRQGWVHVEEANAPEFIGFWMRVFGLTGP